MFTAIDYVVNTFEFKIYLLYFLHKVANFQLLYYIIAW